MAEVSFLLNAEIWVPETLRSKHVIWVAAILPLAFVLAGSMYRERLSPRWRSFVVPLAIALCAAFVLIDAGVIATNVRSPRDWDFKYFWAFGVSVTEGSSPYDHDNLLRIVEPLDPSPELKDELYCFYPPQSLLLFAPLGWLPFKAALLVWSLVQLAALAACLGLMLQLFIKDRSLTALAPPAAMILAFWASSATLAFAQTNFLVLLALLLFWRDRERPIAGIWLALGILVKPLVAAAALYLLMRRRWSGLSMLVIGLAAATLITWLVFGTDTFTDYFEREGVSEQYLLAQAPNQSLSGTLLRLTGMGDTVSSIHQAPFVLVAMLLVVLATAVVIVKSRGLGDPYAVGATLAMMVMIYPGTLTHYGVQLLPPLVLLYSQNQRPGDRRGWALAVILIAFLCAAFKATFLSILLVWIVMSVEGIRLGRQPSETRPETEGESSML